MLSPSELSLRGRIGAHRTHALHDPVETTASARVASATALDGRLLAEIDPEGLLTEEERAKRLQHARKAHFAQLALKSATTRRKKAGGQK